MPLNASSERSSRKGGRGRDDDDDNRVSNFGGNIIDTSRDSRFESIDVRESSQVSNLQQALQFSGS